MNLFIYYSWDEESESEFKIPACYTVCDRCRGTGTHVNPSIDGHGISGNDECWDDDDFRENYFGGVYDVTCQQCEGKRVILVPDEDRMTPEQTAHYERWCEDMWEDDSIARMERMMGA